MKKIKILFNLPFSNVRYIGSISNKINKINKEINKKII